MDHCFTSKPGLTRRVFSCLASPFPGVVTCHVSAENEPAFRLQGFGTLGAVRTSSDEIEFFRDLSQPRGARRAWDGRVDSILGVQANWRPHQQLEAVVQAVSRYRYDRIFKPEISWAYIKYEPRPNLSLRAGRPGTVLS